MHIVYPLLGLIIGHLTSIRTKFLARVLMNRCIGVYLYNLRSNKSTAVLTRLGINAVNASPILASFKTFFGKFAIT